MESREKSPSILEQLHNIAVETSIRHSAASTGVRRMHDELISWSQEGSSPIMLAKYPLTLATSIAMGLTIGTNTFISFAFRGLANITKPTALT